MSSDIFKSLLCYTRTHTHTHIHIHTSPYKSPLANVSHASFLECDRIKVINIRTLLVFKLVSLPEQAWEKEGELPRGSWEQGAGRAFGVKY